MAAYNYIIQHAKLHLDPLQGWVKSEYLLHRQEGFTPHKGPLLINLISAIKPSMSLYLGSTASVFISASGNSDNTGLFTCSL